MLKSGTILNKRYEVISILGEGGMSTVYLVKDRILESNWAMKETLDIFPDKDKKEILDQFKKEANILANLSHPNLPKVIDYFSENKNHYLVEEYINGETSDDLLKNLKSYDEVRILKWALQICDLLIFLHSNGIIYRDLKPGNILIDKNEKVYLVDFGIARFFQGNKNRDTVIIGTPGFASPEHYGRGETDHRSDIYSLGATLHYMNTGVDPANNPFHFEIPYFINPQVSFETSSIIMKCLDLDPTRRFQSPLDVKNAILKRALPSLKKRTKPLTPPINIINKEEYKNQTDFLGKTGQILSYTSIFPATMGISSIIALGTSIFNPILGIMAGTFTFPLLCIEFWKRFDNIYKNQELKIDVENRGITFQNNKYNIETRWLEVIELRIIKSRHSLSFRKIKEIKVKTLRGQFSFDPSFKDYKRLIDTIITYSGLTLIEQGPYEVIYRKL